jgi:hypothetical protein
LDCWPEAVLAERVINVCDVRETFIDRLENTLDRVADCTRVNEWFGIVHENHETPRVRKAKPDFDRSNLLVSLAQMSAHRAPGKIDHHLANPIPVGQSLDHF